jgi:hypothetical protein
MSNTLLLGAVAAAGYYLYTNQQILSGSLGSSEPVPEPVAEVVEEEGDGAVCPAGYTLSPDGEDCISTENPCGEGFVLSADGKQCDSTAPIDPTGGCGEGFIASADGKECLPTGNPCGDDCFVYENNQCRLKDPNCGSLTGSTLGDSLLYMGESVVAGEIYDFIGRKVMKVADRVAAKAAAKQAAKEAAEKAAKEAAEKAAKKFAEAMAKKTEKEVAEAMAKRAAREATKKFALKRASQEIGEALAKRAGGIAAKQTAKQVAIIAGKKLATKIAVMVAKINAQNATGIGVVLSALSVIALGLTVGLAAGGVVFDKNDPNDWDWENLPEGARVALEALPGFGDILAIVMPFIAFSSGCQPGTIDQNGLCYEPPKEGFECEAFLCYAKNSAYPNPIDALSETQAHITKKILMDTGTIPDTAPPGMTKEGAFAYQVSPGYKLVGGTQWGSCQDGQIDDGALCRVPIVFDPCPAGQIDDGLVCRVPITLEGCNPGEVDDGLLCRVPLGGGQCRTWSDMGCHSLGDCIAGRGCGCYGGVHTHCEPITGGTSRAKRSWGGEVYTKGSRGGEVYPKPSNVLAPHSLYCDDSKQNIDGLCYRKDLPAGYTRKTLGLLDQNCPADNPAWAGYAMYNPTQDIGVSCQKATYTRKPYPKFSIYAKKKRVEPPEEPPEPLPSLCKTLTPEKDEGVLCRITECSDGYDLSEDGVSCIKKCNEGFTFNFATKNCERVKEDGELETYDNSAGIIEVIYDYFRSKCEPGLKLVGNECMEEDEPGILI